MRLFPVLAVLALPLAACGESRKDPAPASDLLGRGAQVYRATCASCHGAEGRGVPGAFPPLAGTARVQGPVAPLTRIVLHGLRGPLVVDGQRYDGVMTPHGALLSDDQIAAVLTYVRASFGNEAAAVSPEAVAAERAATRGRTSLYTTEELEAP